jgi:putative transposase
MVPVATMCRALGVSESGYNAWRKRTLSPRVRRDLELTVVIRAAHARFDGSYGAPRLLGGLRDLGHQVGQKHIARLLRAEGLQGISTRRGPMRPQRVTPEAPPAPDPVKRAFRATAPNQLWVADITYIPTMAGFLYLAVVLDVFSRRIVGWCMRDSGPKAGAVFAPTDRWSSGGTERLLHSLRGEPHRMLGLGHRNLIVAGGVSTTD